MRKKVRNLYAAACVLLTLSVIARILFRRLPDTTPDVVVWNCMWILVLLLLGWCACLVTAPVLSRRPAEPGENAPLTGQQKRYVFRGVLLIIAAFVLSGAGLAVGILLIPDGYELICRIVLCAAAAGLFLLFFISRLCRRAYVKRFTEMSVREQQTFLLSHREAAEETAKAKAARLRRMIRTTDALAVLTALAAACGLSALGGAGKIWLGCAAPAAVAAAAVILASLSRIRFPVPKAAFAEDETHVRREDFPTLYDLAWRAMKAVGVDKRLYVSILPDSGAGIAAYDNTCSLNIGALLLGLLSEEELYNILLHEFRHIADENKAKLRLTDYGVRLQAGSGLDLIDLLGGLFRYWDVVYLFELQLFRYADTLSNEAAADAACVQYGNAAAAASALLKLKYYELFEWEDQSSDYTPDFAQPTCERPFMQNRLDGFASRLAEREGLWHELFGKEILARNSTHPTMRMRTEALGVPDPALLPAGWSDAYAAEMKRAMAQADKLLVNAVRDDYAERRKTVFLEPRERVEKWEAEGCPIAPETYADLIADLCSLGRVTDALALCDRVMETWKDSGSDSAAFRKGMILLHRFDEAGVEYLYRAVENNSNFIEEGLDALGGFFCLTGRQAELDDYRERAISKAEEQKEKYDKVSELLPSDHLEPEPLADGMMDKLKEYIGSIADGHILEAYIVRKVITDDFFASPVIIRFCPGTSPDDKWEIMHKMFRYLDSSEEDWQFSLFEYDELPKMQARITRVEGSLIWVKGD